ncbi:MAG: MinD/ParA family protein [Desulfitobacteriia bacterium]|jgi:flagellar biosynthesis protein FlhG
MNSHQVESLRFLVKNKNKLPLKNMRVIAVSSGKGGVGKTNLVVNLALALTEYNYRVIILDGDLGLANVDVVFGITPHYNINHLISGEKRIEEILYPVCKGVQIFPGASGVAELANLDRIQLKNVLSNMGRLERMADILLIDTGAGLGHTVIDFICASDEVIVVMTPEPSSMTDAYGLLKTIKQQAIKIRTNVVVNMAQNEQDARQAYERLEKATTRFLELELNLLGWIYDDPLISRSVRTQKPLGLSAPQSNAYRCIKWIAANMVGDYQKKPVVNKGIRGFIFSLLKIK